MLSLLSVVSHITSGYLYAQVEKDTSYSYLPLLRSQLCKAKNHGVRYLTKCFYSPHHPYPCPSHTELASCIFTLALLAATTFSAPWLLFGRHSQAAYLLTCGNLQKYLLEIKWKLTVEQKPPHTELYRIQ